MEVLKQSVGGTTDTDTGKKETPSRTTTKKDTEHKSTKTITYVCLSCQTTKTRKEEEKTPTPTTIVPNKFVPNQFSDGKGPLFPGININELTDRRIERMIGELVAVQRNRADQQQRQQQGEKDQLTTASTSANNNTTESENPMMITTPLDNTNSGKKSKKRKKIKTSFVFSSNEATYNAVPIPIHKTDEAFTSYHGRKPYVLEIVEAMGRNKNSDEVNYERGAERILSRIAKEYPATYVETGKKAKLAIDGMMDAIALAALIKDVGLNSKGATLMLKHLRYNLGGSNKIAVPFLQTKSVPAETVDNYIKKVHDDTSRGKYNTGKVQSPGDGAPKKQFTGVRNTLRDPSGKFRKIDRTE